MELYKHKTSKALYRLREFSNYGNEMTTVLASAINDDSLPEITITTKKVANTDNYDFKTQKKEYMSARKLNEDAHLADIQQSFEIVECNPTTRFHEVPKYIKIACSIDCPLCGSPMKWNCKTLLTYPAKYPHKCTNSKCGFEYNNSRYHEGEIFYGESVEEVERLLNGTLEEYDEIKLRKQ